MIVRNRTTVPLLSVKIGTWPDTQRHLEREQNNEEHARRELTRRVHVEYSQKAKVC